ncbi:hypothetical protein PV05_01474 [Exophiala xenobiotica]|uniref:Uncharacterized protein n=1 Tax=Exophiala xenobiotica TaxID=348802 RepID=A0A0D2F079_9EURO|nr:uncharacterized protein PV05_01474 [Exophiala xenobiotica]KIW61343.1 hypothetical protein PV05_01474 [Exophiala xenobiotica]
MIATCRNLATDRVFEETERSLFLRKEDPDSRIEAYVAVDPTISSDWHELSPVVDLSDADSVQFEALLEKKPFKLATDASGSVSSAKKQISAAKLAIQSTKADMEFLQAQLQSYRSEAHEDMPTDLQKWKRQFAEILRNLNVNLMRLDEIYSRLQSLTGMLSSFLELNSSYALQSLTEESRRESETMRKLNEKMSDMAEKTAEEAVTVTVLAILTMVYLPFTVVSNFFSTSFVGLGTFNLSDHIYMEDMDAY